jgi:hypothetical protein
MTIPLTILSFFLEDANFSGDAQGVFAWVMPEFIKIVMFVSIVVGVIGINLNSYAVLYILPLYISLVKLCDPLLTSMFAFLSGVDPFPSEWTFIGGSVTAVGIGILSYGANKRKRREQETVELDIPNQVHLECDASVHDEEAGAGSTDSFPLENFDEAKQALLNSTRDCSSSPSTPTRMRKEFNPADLEESEELSSKHEPYIPFTLPTASHAILEYDARVSTDKSVPPLQRVDIDDTSCSSNLKELE